MEINAALSNGVKDIEYIARLTGLWPLGGSYRVIILDEVEGLTKAAAAALRKPLEEPGPHDFFILCTNEFRDIPRVIRSRCQHYAFDVVGFDELVTHLAWVAKQEGFRVSRKRLGIIARSANGRPRDALIGLEMECHLNGLA